MSFDPDEAWQQEAEDAFYAEIFDQAVDDVEERRK